MKRCIIDTLKLWRYTIWDIQFEKQTDEYEKEITIHTTATDKKTGEKVIVAGKKVTIVDTVTLDGL